MLYVLRRNAWVFLDSPEVIWVPLGQRWPVIESVADDAGFVGANPLAIKL